MNKSTEYVADKKDKWPENSRTFNRYRAYYYASSCRVKVERIQIQIPPWQKKLGTLAPKHIISYNSPRDRNMEIVFEVL